MSGVKFAKWVRTADPIAFPYTRLPAYTILPMLPILVYARPITIFLAVLCTIVTWRLSAKGVSIMWLARRFKGTMRNRRQSSRPLWHIRRYCHRYDPIRF